MRIHRLACALERTGLTTVRRVYIDPTDGQDVDLMKSMALGFQNGRGSMDYDFPRASMLAVTVESPLVSFDIEIDELRIIRVAVVKPGP